MGLKMVAIEKFAICFLLGQISILLRFRPFASSVKNWIKKIDVEA